MSDGWLLTGIVAVLAGIVLLLMGRGSDYEKSCYLPDEVEFLHEQGRGCIFVGWSLILFYNVSFNGGNSDYQTVATILVFASAFIRMSAGLSYCKKTRRVGVMISLFVAIAAHVLFFIATFYPESFQRLYCIESGKITAETELSMDDYDEP